MSQYKTAYNDHYISYWPYYTIGRIGICSLCALEVLILITSLWSLLDEITNATRIEIIVTVPTVTLVFGLLCLFIVSKMYINITVSLTGIILSNDRKNKKHQIAWEDVHTIYFYTDGWYGRTSYRVFLKNTIHKDISHKRACDFVIPVNDVDIMSLHMLIPSSLFKTAGDLREP